MTLNKLDINWFHNVLFFNKRKSLPQFVNAIAYPAQHNGTLLDGQHVQLPAEEMVYKGKSMFASLRTKTWTFMTAALSQFQFDLVMRNNQSVMKVMTCCHRWVLRRCARMLLLFVVTTLWWDTVRLPRTLHCAAIHVKVLWGMNKACTDTFSSSLILGSIRS